MGRTDPGFLVVGILDKVHGIKGAFFVRALTDHPESTFAPGVVLRMGDETGQSPDPDLPPLRVTSAQPHRHGFLMSFGGVETRNEAEVLRGRYLLRPMSELEPLEDGELFYHQLLGMEVVLVDGTRLGEVAEVYELEPSDLLEVRGQDKEYMIPFRDPVVVNVDVDAGKIVVDPPEGLLDL